MSAPTPIDSPVGQTTRRTRRALALALLALLAAFAGWRWSREGVPDPPEVPTTSGENTDAARVIGRARRSVVEKRRSGGDWGHLGLAFTAYGFDDQAAECYRTAHRLDPTDDRWPYLLALYYLTDERDPAAAVGHLETAFRCPHADPRKEEAVRLRLAETYLAERRTDDAERLFRAHLRGDPLDPRAALGLGVALLTLGRPDEAGAALLRAVDSPFTRRRAAANLGIASRQSGRLDDAARYDGLTAALPEDMPVPDPFAAEAAALRVAGSGGFDAVAALEQGGRFADTIPILTRLADSGDVRATLALARNLSLLGRFAAAEPHARAACAREPDNARAAAFLATVLFDLARSETGDRRGQLLRESEEASARAVKLRPGLGLAHLSLGAAVRERGDTRAALPHFRTAAECTPEVPQVQLALLQSLVENGLFGEARTQLPAAEKVVARDSPILNELRKRIEQEGGATGRRGND